MGLSFFTKKLSQQPSHNFWRTNNRYSQSKSPPKQKSVPTASNPKPKPNQKHAQREPPKPGGQNQRKKHKNSQQHNAAANPRSAAINLFAQKTAPLNITVLGT
ncbi:MAG: hypothetical protein RSD32_02990 [Oscillospiraceae bacterium]